MTLNKDGRMVITADKFKDLLEGKLFDEPYFKNFYNAVDFPETKWIDASNLEIEGNILIESNKFFSFDITLSNCIFLNDIKVERGKFKKIWFVECTFKEHFLINNIEIKKRLWFNSCSFKKGLRIYHGNLNDFRCINSTFLYPLNVYGGNFIQFHLSSIEKKSNINITGLFTKIDYLRINSSININITKCIINSIEFNGVFDSSSMVVIKDIKLYTLIFEKIVNLGKFFLLNISLINELYEIEDIDIANIPNISSLFQGDFELDEFKNFLKKHRINTLLEYLNNFYTPSSFIEKNKIYFTGILYKSKVKNFDDLKINQSTFKILETTLGEIQFTNFEIEKFEEIVIDSSDLSLVKTLNSRFPTEKGLIKTGQNRYKNLYHTYNDLFSIASRQNNLKDKINYYKASQENLLLATKKDTFSFNKLSSLASLSVSKHFSDYGQNWIKALGLTIILCFLFFGLLILSLENIKFDLSTEGFTYYFKNLLQYFPQFLNPVHQLNFINSFGIAGKWSPTIDLLSRILTGIGIYEIIRSFRKYIRK
ncbi:MAG: hypothetical protein QM486_01730 [Flavobacteriaceae bacterium]